jgi:hypothetical protein
MLSVNVVSSVLGQFVSLTTGPGGLGDPGPIQYLLSTHSLIRPPHESDPNFYFERSVAVGNMRLDLTGVHAAVEAVRDRRRRMFDGTGAIRLFSSLLERGSSALESYAGRRLDHQQHG